MLNRGVYGVWLEILNDYYRSVLGLSKQQLRVSGICQFDISGVLSVGRGLYFRSRNHNPVEISVHANAILAIDDNGFINQGVSISASKEMRIMQNPLIGDDVFILDNDFHSAIGEPQPGKIPIEENAWIGSRSIILRDATLGRGSEIGDRAVVTNSIPARSLAVGFPGRVIDTYR
jgi:acetyltransferase-like isoleucine patch superfamily enzyme